MANVLLLFISSLKLIGNAWKLKSQFFNEDAKVVFYL